MNGEFKREDRYVVFKISDVVEHFTKTEALHLARLYEIQRVGRKDAGKVEFECVVVESDWPEYEPTWKAIEARVTGAQSAPSVPECPYPCGWQNLLKHAIEDGAYLARSINEDKPVTENARAVTMRTVMRLRDVLMAINKAVPEAKS